MESNSWATMARLRFIRRLLRRSVGEEEKLAAAAAASSLPSATVMAKSDPPRCLLERARVAGEVTAASVDGCKRASMEDSEDKRSDETIRVFIMLRSVEGAKGCFLASKETLHSPSFDVVKNEEMDKGEMS